MGISGLIFSIQKSSLEMRILGDSASCFHVVSRFSWVTMGGIMQELAEQSLVAHGRPLSAKQSEPYESLSIFETTF